jgi:hypothetical protein
MSEINVSMELRPCILTLNNQKLKAIFHCFTINENAIVEFEDGRCTTVAPWCIQFVNSKVSEYNYSTDKE